MDLSCCSELLTGIVPYTDLRAETQVGVFSLPVHYLEINFFDAYNCGNLSYNVV